MGKGYIFCPLRLRTLFYPHRCKANRTAWQRFSAVSLAGLLSIVGMSIPIDAAPRARAIAKLIGLDGREIGKATFQQVARGILIEVDAHDTPPGAHAIMIHATGACDPKKQFTTAGPDLDFDPPRPHGYLVTGGPRPGDLPNQFSAVDGTLHATMFSTYFSLGNGKTSLFDRDGASIIVNAKADDYRTPPDGNAGARIACGTIIRLVGPATHRKPAVKK
jgi:superoxide dismutase, Cu-Zn family